MVKLADGHLQRRVTQKHVTNIGGAVNFRYLCCFGREDELEMSRCSCPIFCMVVKYGILL